VTYVLRRFSAFFHITNVISVFRIRSIILDFIIWLLFVNINVRLQRFLYSILPYAVFGYSASALQTKLTRQMLQQTSNPVSSVRIPIAFYVLCSSWDQYDEVKLSKELVRVLRHGLYKNIKIDSGNFWIYFILQTFCKNLRSVLGDILF